MPDRDVADRDESMSGYATCDECGNPLSDSEHFRGSVCDSCARSEHLCPHCDGDGCAECDANFVPGAGHSRRVVVTVDPGDDRPIVVYRRGRTIHRLSVEDALGHIHDLSTALLRLEAEK